MKTIVQINSVINKGSTGRICQGIGLQAQENGWDNHIVFGRKSNSTDLNTYDIGSTFSFIQHLGASLLFDAHGKGSRNSTLKLCNWLDEIKPDVVHLHNVHGYYLHVPSIVSYLREKKISVVWTLHDCWSFTGHCSYYSDINCEKWKTECHKCPKTKNYPKSLFIDNSSHNYRWKKKLFSNWEQLEIVTVSKWLEHEVRKGFLKAENIRTIYNGVDKNIFHPSHDLTRINKKFDLEQKFVALAAATAWSETKGLKDYIKLASYLREDEVIVLIGLDLNTIKNLPKGIIGLHRTENQTELAEWYTRANVVLNLSTQETFGMTSIEGFACGTPSIVYNTTASPELVDEGTGVVIEPHDLDAVYDNMVKIKNNQLAITKEKCLARVENNFDSKKQFNKYIELYESLS
ncbi:MAG TPA: glycosyl transferase [Flavobacteriales bacterium]|nr:glycosyl transferase [Flavobacteriales bacterium]